jgi:hypothetical protein
MCHYIVTMPVAYPIQYNCARRPGSSLINTYASKTSASQQHAALHARFDKAYQPHQRSCTSRGLLAGLGTTSNVYKLVHIAKCTE